MKRVFIVHGWDGYPEEGWFPWLKKELKKNGFEAHVPEMPDPKKPKIDAWISHLGEVVGVPDEETFFVGHSVGCQAIIRYLESLPPGVKVGGVVLVAGWFVLPEAETEEERIIGLPWVETPIDFDNVRARTSRFISIFSDNDEVIPKENKEMVADRLGAKTITEYNKGHFSGGDGVTELPSVLNAVLEIAGEI